MLDIAGWMGGLPFAELGGIIVPILCALLGGGGVWALLGARTSGKATERAAFAAAQATERAASAAAHATERAAALVSTPVTQQAMTADWSALMTFWQSEMNVMREAHSRLQIKVEILAHEREDDLRHIEDLEQHIWNELPPPPPLRRRYRIPEEET